MSFHLDYANVVMQERLEEARQMRLLREALKQAPKSPSRLRQMVSNFFQAIHSPAPRAAQNRLTNPVECQ